MPTEILLTPLLACPYCESEIGRQVWAGIFNGDFWGNAALTLLPIAVLLLIVILIHFGPTWPARPLPKPWPASVPDATSPPHGDEEPERWRATSVDGR